MNVHPSGLMVFVAAACCLCSAPVAAQEPTGEQPAGHRWTIQVDPLTTALGFVHAQVERTLGDYVSLYLGPHLRLFSAPFLEPEDFTGYGAEVGVRWYFRGGAPSGWWALARGVGAYLQTGPSEEQETAPGGYASLLGGHTFIISDWLVLSLGAGLQYLHYTVGGLGPRMFAPALHTAVGVAF